MRLRNTFLARRIRFKLKLIWMGLRGYRFVRPFKGCCGGSGCKICCGPRWVPGKFKWADFDIQVPRYEGMTWSAYEKQIED